MDVAVGVAVDAEVTVDYWVDVAVGAEVTVAVDWVVEGIPMNKDCWVKEAVEAVGKEVVEVEEKKTEGSVVRRELRTEVEEARIRSPSRQRRSPRPRDSPRENPFCL